MERQQTSYERGVKHATHVYYMPRSAALLWEIHLSLRMGRLVPERRNPSSLKGARRRLDPRDE